VNPETAAKSLMAEIQSGSFDRTISKAQHESVELKKRVKDDKVKQWMDGFMGELVAEKGRLHELAKKVNMSIRQKELEFKNKEQAMYEDVRRRDEQIRQKDYAVVRAKDQISQLATALDRAKRSGATSSDDAGYQQKFQHVTKMLSSTKDENHHLSKKIDDLKKQLTIAKTLGKNQGPSVQEYNALQDRYEKQLKQMDEFKRQTQLLTEKLAESRSRSSAAGAHGGSDENGRRLEAAMKALTLGKRDQEKLANRVSEMQRDETRLKVDLAKAQAEARRLRALLGSAAQDGDDSGSGNSGKPPKTAA
jgi:hypothetical protein